MLTIDPTHVNAAALASGVFDEKRALEKNLATGATTCALAFASGQQSFVVGGVNVS
jgi:hypothetical protein